ncbi:MAG: hypothetical protein WDZ77_02840 [Candidatus Pacearchaeota archaeon]
MEDEEKVSEEEENSDEESELEKEIEEEEVENMPDSTEIKILPEERTVPVLDKIASQREFGDLEEEATFTLHKRDEEDEIKYESVGRRDTGYFSGEDSNQETNYSFSETQPNLIEDDEEVIETRRRIFGGEFRQNRNSNLESMPGLGDDKETRETKKYVSQGEYNPNS